MPRFSTRDESTPEFDHEWVIRRLKEMLIELSPEHQSAVLDELGRCVAGGSVEDWINTETRQSQDRRRLPRPGSMDRHRKFGMDSAPGAFFGRFPGARRIARL